MARRQSAAWWDVVFADIVAVLEHVAVESDVVPGGP